MLVLSRKPGEKLQVGDNITITVLGIQGRVMRIGIEAPGNVRILRGELTQFCDPVHPAPQQERARKHEPSPAAVAV
jgi:carbon storage regulator